MSFRQRTEDLTHPVNTGNEMLVNIKIKNKKINILIKIIDAQPKFSIKKDEEARNLLFSKFLQFKINKICNKNHANLPLLLLFQKFCSQII